MILSLIHLPTENHVAQFQEFNELCRQRYSLYISQPFQAVDPRTYYTVIKPFNAGGIPFLMLDQFIHMRRANIRAAFVHDMVNFSEDGSVRLDVNGPGYDAASRLITSIPAKTPGLKFAGFGQRIDIALNALSALYLHMLSTFTKVEAETLQHLRDLQFSKFNDPIVSRTYGLQKVVAENLGKSPVAIHKSLRSSQYQSIADTAQAMRELIA